MCATICTKILLKGLVAIVSTSAILINRINKILFHVNAADAKPDCKLQKTTKWNFKWDHRKRPSAGNEPSPPTVTRNILLIRHGQYHTNSGRLKKTGKQQAKLTSEKLAKMHHKYYRKMISSTMRRAIETLIAIKNENFHLDMDFENDLCERFAIYPEPPSQAVFSFASSQRVCEDGRRLERAFKKYFYRAFPDETDSYEIIVCHANLIRYFICRALQLPPEAWMRFTINNGSITWFVIHPDGRVQLKYAGDSAYMPTKLQKEY